MVMVFEQGDIVYLDFDPQAGHEQRGRRPALVVSNNTFNRFSSLTMVCPIDYPHRPKPSAAYPLGRKDTYRWRDYVRPSKDAGFDQPTGLFSGKGPGGYFGRGSGYNRRNHRNSIKSNDGKQVISVRGK